MAYLTDIEIAQSVEMKPITEIAKSVGIDEKYIEQYGKYKAKLDLSLLSDTKKEDGKLILVTAITPTPAGEGKTTTTIGLADGMRRIGKKTAVALREPSLGPVFGVKGGAAGGGYAQVVPMEDINLHFTGDFHAIGAANNLIAAMLDNHIYQGNQLNIDLVARPADDGTRGEQQSRLLLGVQAQIFRRAAICGAQALYHTLALGAIGCRCLFAWRACRACEAHRVLR